MRNTAFRVVCVWAALSLSACANVQADIDNGFSGIKEAFSNFHPFDDLHPINQVAANTPAKPPAPLSPAERAESKRATPSRTARTEEKTVAVAGTGDSACPPVHIVRDLNQVHQFKNPASPKPDEGVSTIRMDSVKRKCTVASNTMAIDMDVAFDGTLGPDARMRRTDKPSFAYPYFVAITNNQGSIVAKEVFAVTLDYGSNQNQESHSEQIRQLIPLRDRDYRNYKILVGFQLTDQELAFNRSLPASALQPVPRNPVTIIEPAAGEH